MSSSMGDDKYNEASVSLTLQPSRRLAAFVVLGASATLVLCIALPLPPLIRLAACAWCAAAACHALFIHTRTRHVVIHPGVVLPGSFVAPWLTIVRWVPPGARFSRSLVILPDMLDAESFRRLRMVLRWGKAG
jgi:hypothetical protein